eukprot:3171455-Amphidinium_carterae.1
MERTPSKTHELVQEHVKVTKAIMCPFLLTGRVECRCYSSARAWQPCLAVSFLASIRALTT